MAGTELTHIRVKLRRWRVEKRLRQKTESLVIRNAAKVREVHSHHAKEINLRFGMELDRHLAETSKATHGAIRAAMLRPESKATIASEEVPRLAVAAADLVELRAKLCEGVNLQFPSV